MFINFTPLGGERSLKEDSLLLNCTQKYDEKQRMTNKKKYIAPICAGLVALVGAGVMAKSFHDLGKDYSGGFPEIRTLIETQHQKNVLNYFIKKEEMIAPQTLFENESALLKHYTLINERLQKFSKTESDLLADPRISATYETYLNYRNTKQKQANNLALMAFGLFMPSLLYLMYKTPSKGGFGLG